MRNFSAEIVLSDRLKIIFISSAFIYLILLFSFFDYAIYGTLILFNALYAFIAAYRLWIFFKARKESQSQEVVQSIALPRYTILIPLYKEAEVVESLVAHMSRLNYSTKLLQILLILEEDDAITIDSVERIVLPSQFSVVKVPKSYPRTKAKACNYALNFITGELITIYDAEDRPDLDQLLKAASEFSNSGDDLACLQAELCFYNKDENLLTAMFAIEYRMLFGYMLPSQTAMQMPIPLGGTSNHFKADVIKALGGWDPYNVTEDAELGLRLKLNDCKIGMLNSKTEEEAVIDLPAWINQRTRWIKGHLHTYLCYLRHPGVMLEKFGFGGVVFITYMLFLNPICLMTAPIVVLYAATAYFFLEVNMVFLYLSWMNIVFCTLSLIITSCIAAFSLKSRFALRYALIFPIYMILHIYAAIAALKNLIVSPHFWSKTAHGRSRVSHN